MKDKNTDYRWEVAPYINLRLAGMSYDNLTAFNFERSIKLANQILELEKWFNHTADQVNEQLYKVIPTLTSNAERNTLIRIKRAIYNRNNFKDNPGLLTELEPKLQNALIEWNSHFNCYNELKCEAEQTLAEELEKARTLLRQQATDPDLQKGILASSEVLFEALQRYLKAEQITNRERRAEHTLLLYLTRMITKPSPYATFTTSSIGRFVPENSFDWELSDLQKRSFVSFNISAAAIMMEALSRSVFVRPHLPVRVNSAARLNGHKIEFYQAQLRAITPFVMRKGGLRRLEAKPMILAILDFARQGQDTEGMTYNRLIEQLAIRQPTLDQRKLTEFIEKLLNAGLLEICPQLPSDNPNQILATLRTVLESVPPVPEIINALNCIQHLEELRFAYEQGDVFQRQNALRQANREIELFHEYLQAENVFEYPKMGLFLEDCTSNFEKLEMGQELVKYFAADLQTLHQLAICTSPTGLYYTALEKYFVTQYGTGGTCQDVLGFLESYSQWMKEQTAALQNPMDYDALALRLDTPEINQALAVRARLDDFFSQKYAQWQVQASRQPLQLERAEILNLLSERPGHFNQHSSMTFFAQLAAANRQNLAKGDFQLILNRPLAGDGQLFSRYCYMLDSQEEKGSERNWLVEAIRKTLKAQSDTKCPVEIVASFDASNVQLHPRLTEYELVWPGETPSRMTDYQLALNELVLYHDPARREVILHSPRLKQDIAIHYMGFLVPVVLPNLVMATLNFSRAVFPGSLAIFDEFEQKYQKGQAVAPQPLRYYPRLCLGKIVIERARWDIENSVLPHRQPHEGDAEYYRRLLSWKQELGLPDQIFVRVNHSTVRENIEDHKPIMFDFNNYLHMQYFDKLVKPTDYSITITEMLPTPQDLFFQQAGERFVTELQFEVSEQKISTNQGEIKTELVLAMNQVD
jgi:hypothetical protein